MTDVTVIGVQRTSNWYDRGGELVHHFLVKVLGSFALPQEVSWAICLFFCCLSSRLQIYSGINSHVAHSTFYSFF
jgi:hypothetical protein